MRFLSTFGQLPGTAVNLVVIILWGFTEGIGLMLFLPLLELLTGGDPQALQWPFNYVTRAFDAFGLAVTLNSILIAISGLILGSLCLGFLQRYLLMRSKQMYTLWARRTLTAQLFQASWDHISRQSHGNVINQIVTECHRAGNALQYEVLGVAAAVQVGIFVVISSFLSIELMIVTVLFGALTFAVVRPLQRRAKIVGNQTTVANHDLNFYGVDFLRGAKLIKVTATDGEVIRRMGKHINAVFRVSFSSELLAAQLYFIVQTLPVLLFAGIIAVSHNLLDLSASAILVFLLFLARLAPKVAQLQQQTQGYAVTSPAIRLIKQTLADSADAAEKIDQAAEPFVPMKRAIEITDVSYAYQKDDGPVLKNINLSIPHNRMIAIVGKSGAGKSTVIDLLAALRRPDTGQILVDGTDLNKINIFLWRANIGYVTQDVMIFNDTVRNNVTFANPDSTDEDIERAISLAQFSDVLRTLPEGMETVLGEGGVRLSGGQKQRLALARALAGNPNLLLLDEATSALDNESERLIQEAIESIARTMTVVVIAHRLSTVVKADLIYVLENGRIVEQGTYDELVAESGTFAELHKLQFA